MSNEYYKKDEQKLLIAILDKYIEDNGDQLVALDAYQFSSLDPSLFETVPRITKEKVRDRQNSDSRYFGNLKEKEFISGKDIASPFHFRLTKSGYEEGHRLKSPKLHFCKEHWKFLFGSLLTFISVTCAILRYINCPSC
jgi:hypothetical protein